MAMFSRWKPQGLYECVDFPLTRNFSIDTALFSIYAFPFMPYFLNWLNTFFYWHDAFLFTRRFGIGIAFDTKLSLLTRHFIHWHDTSFIDPTLSLLTQNFLFWPDISSIDTTLRLLTRNFLCWPDISCALSIVTAPFIPWLLHLHDT